MIARSRFSLSSAGIGARVRAWLARIPNSWFVGILTGLFLIVTAAFGGLATVPQAAPPFLASGERHVNEQLSLTIERAVLIDDFPEAGARAAEGQRVLSLVVEAQNLWDQPLPTTGDFSVSQALRIDVLGQQTPPEAVARFDDATYAPWLQPGVPAKLVVSWLVPRNTFEDSEEIAITVRDASLRVGQMVASGSSWGDPKPAASTSVRVEDIGAG